MGRDVHVSNLTQWELAIRMQTHIHSSFQENLPLKQGLLLTLDRDSSGNVDPHV